MRHELWGLRKIDTKEPVYTYWASSNRHRALFARRDEAERACLNPRNGDMEPFRITGSDVGEPERHGRWEIHLSIGHRTSGAAYAEFEIPLTSSEEEAEASLYKHCPECTARMDKEKAL